MNTDLENKKTILVVEDTIEIREELVSVLKMENFLVLEANNGCEALEIMENQTTDIIVTDLLMPIMGGEELIKTINSKNINIPIIIMSAKSEKEDIERGLNLGVRDYLTKPCTTEAFILSIDKVVMTLDSF
jgi:two-component system OmpR family response regulator